MKRLQAALALLFTPPQPLLAKSQSLGSLKFMDGDPLMGVPSKQQGGTSDQARGGVGSILTLAGEHRNSALSHFGISPDAAATFSVTVADFVGSAGGPDAKGLPEIAPKEWNSRWGGAAHVATNRPARLYVARLAVS